MRALRTALPVLVLALAVLAGVASAGGAAARSPERPVVVVGVPGLRWSDVSERGTPALWSLAGEGAVAALSVRSVRSATTCPADGWAVLGAGQRVALPAPEAPSGGSTGTGTAAPDPGACPPVPEPREGPDGGAVVPGVGALAAQADADDYGARVGLLAEQLATGGLCATAVGDGAALALADRAGRVARAVPGDAPLDPALLGACPLTVVDAGAVVEQGLEGSGPVPPRAEQAAAADARLAQVLDAAPRDAVVLVVGPGDAAPADPHLSVLVASGGPYGTPGGDGGDGADGTDGGAWLTTTSTRRLGLAQLTDVLPTVLRLLGLVPPAAATGQEVRAEGERPALGAVVGELRDLDTAAQVADAARGPYFTVLVGSQIVLYGAAAVALRRRWPVADRGRVLRATRAGALAFAAMPVATFLAQTVPWWRQEPPVASLVGAVVLWMALLTAAALLGPWRRDLLGPMGFVAVVTAVVLGVDVVTGSRLQLSSLMGYSPLVAGRFYGFGNVPFALFAAASTVAAAVLAAPLLRRGRRRAAGLLAGALGVVAVAVDGVWGADFGGVIALVPGFAVLAMGLAGIRLTVRRLAGVVLLGGATVTAIAVADRLRPTPTHLGRFVQQVLDGEAWEVVLRKADANVSILLVNPWLSSLVPVGVAFLVLVLMRPVGWRAGALELAYARAPALRPAVVGATTALVVGALVNDSGVAVTAAGLVVALPLVLAACVTALVRADADGPRDAPGDGPGPAAPGAARAAAGPAPTRG